MAISKRTRFEVFKRDLFTCQYCGKKPPEVMLECDHVVPVCEGGDGGLENLTTACTDCNRGKAGVSLGKTAPALNELQVLAGIQEMMERATVLRQSAAAAKAVASTEAEVIETLREWWLKSVGSDHYMEDTSLRRFLHRLSVERLREAVDATAVRDRKGRDAWKYFCGVCWKMIREDEAEGAE